MAVIISAETKTPLAVSFEFFPPKTEEGKTQLLDAADQLALLDPEYISVTYGASGSDRGRTADLVEELSDRVTTPLMPHLTCVAHTEAEIDESLKNYKRMGINHILALAGDTPNDGKPYKSDFSHAVELVEKARAVGGFSIGVAAHPEGHPESANINSDRRYLAQKLELADFGITQFFFNPDDYERLVDDLSKLDVNKPVIPGILPINNVDGLYRMASLNNTYIPMSLRDRLEKARGNSSEIENIGVDVATNLADRLISIGAPAIHLYTMNKAQSSIRVIKNLDI